MEYVILWCLLFLHDTMFPGEMCTQSLSTSYFCLIYILKASRISSPNVKVLSLWTDALGSTEPRLLSSRPSAGPGTCLEAVESTSPSVMSSLLRTANRRSLSFTPRRSACLLNVSNAFSISSPTVETKLLASPPSPGRKDLIAFSTINDALAISSQAKASLLSMDGLISTPFVFSILTGMSGTEVKQEPSS